MSFEEYKMVNREEDRESTSQAENDLHKEALVSAKGWEEYMMGFEGVYPRKTIESDIKKIKSISNQKDFMVHTIRGKILEWVIEKYSDGSSWWGEGVLAESSKFDDFFNGVDCVLEFPIENEDGEEEFVRLAIDVTVAKDVDTIYKKKNSIENHLLRGDMSKVKYFTSSEEVDDNGESVKKSLSGIPKVMICLSDDEDIKELSEIIKGKGLGQREITKELSKDIRHLVFLRDIQIQMIWQGANLLDSFLKK